MITKLCNPNAQDEAKVLMEYLAGVEGKGILTGQHTQSIPQEELACIQRETGKLPALCGFELLGYSPNIRLDDADEACITEVLDNRGTLDKAWDWANRGGIITFTWHWFSPLGGRDKAFYAANTDFDAQKALQPGTPENVAFYHDMDHMAELLRPFCEARIPILWRPFHEAEGKWFWWGAKGVEVARELFREMHRHYTKVHHLDNLIWVWNSPDPAGYVGDEYCDIVSRDLDPSPHAHGAYEDRYAELVCNTSADKGAALAEIGVIPDPEALARLKTPWLWYMTWSHGFVLAEEHNTYDALRRLYGHEWAITLDKLPEFPWKN